MSTPYKGLVVEEVNGKFERSIKILDTDDLPMGDVLIEVKYSSLNYKDALSATGHKGVTRNYPHTPGIDAAGLVIESHSPEFMEGEEVLVTGYDLGMNTPGGFGRYIRVPADWVVHLPEGITLKESMILGTAGFTAALGMQKLQMNGVFPGEGEVLVTGASGGVGCLAVAMLSQAGYEVTASTGKKAAEGFLRELGALNIITREEVNDVSGKALLEKRWAGVFDTVGGSILETAIRTTNLQGSVVTCGLTQSPDLRLTVYPFILRGINLLGINSAETPMPQREMIWEQLAMEWKPETIDLLHKTIGLDELSPKIDEILQGKVQGRIVLAH